MAQQLIMRVVNIGPKVDQIKINSVSSASVVLFGDTQGIVTDCTSVTTPVRFYSAPTTTSSSGAVSGPEAAAGPVILPGRTS